jgi:ABC-type nickel/cobalt efflux system permease component RcnA
MAPGSTHRSPDVEAINARIDALADKFDQLQSQVAEIHTVRKLFSWAVPTFAMAAISFIITAAVGLYKIEQTMQDMDEHRRQSAMTAHPGTSDAMWGVRADLQHTRDQMESEAREHAIRDGLVEQRLGRIENQIGAVLASVRERR